MTDINIVIIGAYNYQNNNSKCDYKDWNNNNQASHEDIVDCIKHIKTLNQSINITVYCIDPMYDYNATIDNIHYIKNMFVLENTGYCIKEGHTIFIEFCNLLDEYYVTKEYTEHPILQYNDYKITWLSCGCQWTHKFPKELIENIIKYDIYTPTNIKSSNSHMYAYKFNNSYNDIIFSPYCQGLYQILGTYLWRGSKTIYQHEEVLYDFTSKLLEELQIQPEMKDDLVKFIDKEIRWNTLQRSTREKLNSIVFGKNITIS